MQPSLSRPRRRSCRSAVRGAALIATAALAVAGGCTPTSSFLDGHSQSEGATLPALSSAQQLRGTIALTEVAIGTRLNEMSLAATDCAGCAGVLASATHASLARLSETGGAWEDTGGTTTSSPAIWNTSGPDLPLGMGPAAPPAPYTVPPLTAFMVRTGEGQLLEVAHAADLTSGQRLGLGSILVARLGSAYQLANYFAVDVPKAAKTLPTEEVAPFLPVDPGRGGETLGHSQQPQSSDLAEDRPVSTAEDALVGFDCARTNLLASPEELLEPAELKSLNDELNRRMNSLVSVGVPDHRGLRCAAKVAGEGQALRSLLTADLALLGSEDVQLREAGAHYIVEDVARWAAISPLTLPTESLLTIEDGSNA